ncbi:MAG: hypothetical protein ACE5JL_17990 [Dehalococcoidia bacterium]
MRLPVTMKLPVTIKEWVVTVATFAMAFTAIVWGVVLLLLGS